MLLPCCVASQVEAFDTSVNLYGQFAFLLWRSVYITKQVRLARCCDSSVGHQGERGGCTPTSAVSPFL